MIAAGQSSEYVLSFITGREAGPVVSRRERACSQRETNGARTRAGERRGREAANKERNKCSG